MEVNVNKTKIVRFRKSGRRLTKREWKWKGKAVEEMKEYRYLRYVLRKNGNQEAHVIEQRW